MSQNRFKIAESNFRLNPASSLLITSPVHLPRPPTPTPPLTLPCKFEGNLAQTCAQIDDNSISFATTLIKWFLVTRSIKRASTEGQESNSSNSPDERDTLAMTDGEVLGETAALALTDGDKRNDAAGEAV